MKNAYCFPFLPIHSFIIETLAKNKAISLKELFALLRDSYNIKLSKASLYRIISQMIEKHVLVKHKDKISLNYSWIPHLLELCKIIKLNYFSNQNIDIINMKDKEKQIFWADSQANLDPIWNNYVIQISKISTSKQWYSYKAHPWQELATKDTELQVFQSIAKFGSKVSIFYGNNTFLDNYGKSLLTIKNTNTFINTSHTFLESNYALDVCDDYIIECFLDDELAKHFELFFQSVKEKKDFEESIFKEVYKSKRKCKLVFEKNHKKAKKLSKKIQNYIKT
jgi:hypothetical protein